MQVIGDALWDAFLDTLKIILVLYLAYLVIGYLTHHKSKGYAKLFKNSKKTGPLIGAFLGCVPQCGFSSVMADVYSKKAVSLGTLIAVFIATSDEAIPILLGNPDYYIDILVLIGFKVAFAILFGYIIDLFVALFSRGKKIDVMSSNKVEKIIENADEERHHCDCSCHDENACGHEKHDEKHKHCCADNIFLDALIHTLNIAIFIFIATFLINILISYVGLDFITSWLGDNAYLQILLCSLIGLIPNCASSVFLVEMYINGGIMFSAMLAGLSVGSGIGIFVLFSKNRGKKQTLQNILILLLLYGLGVVAGIITNLFGITHSVL